MTFAYVFARIHSTITNEVIMKEQNAYKINCMKN